MKKIIFYGIILSFLGTGSLMAQEDPSESIAENYLTGNWGGFRQKMADKGVTFEVVYTSEILKNTFGGLSKDYAVIGNLDVTLDMDMENLVGWTGGEIFLYGLGGHRSLDPSAIVGDAQASSNIESGMNFFKLYEAWIKQSIGGEKFSVLLGLHDLNSEFYANDPAGLFFNSSFGIGADFSQSGENGPSIFPNTALAAVLKTMPVENFYAIAGVYNAISGDPNQPEATSYDFTFNKGILAAVEAGYYKEGNIKIGIGGWLYSNPVPDIKSGADTTGYGAYFIYDKTIKDIAFFVRFGFANPLAYAVEFNVAEGITVSGSLWKRDNDQLGLAATTVIASTELQNTGIDTQETAIELTYLLQATPWLSVQPDIQYIINPSMDPAVNDALVVSARVTTSF